MSRSEFHSPGKLARRVTGSIRKRLPCCGPAVEVLGIPAPFRPSRGPRPALGPGTARLLWGLCSEATTVANPWEHFRCLQAQTAWPWFVPHCSYWASLEDAARFPCFLVPELTWLPAAGSVPYEALRSESRDREPWVSNRTGEGDRAGQGLVSWAPNSPGPRPEQLFCTG